VRARHTIHEVWAIDQETTLLRIDIAEHSIVDKVVPKGVSYHDDYALWCNASFGIGYVSLEAMNFSYGAGGGASVNTAFEAVCARSCHCCGGVLHFAGRSVSVLVMLKVGEECCVVKVRRKKGSREGERLR